MANWDAVLRQILLKGNFFSGEKALLISDYAAAPSDAVMTANDAEYSFAALLDACLDAHAEIVKAIGDNRGSEHRAAFLQSTGSITSGSNIPSTISSVERYGVISNIRDAADNRILTFQPQSMIITANETLGRNYLEVYYYYTDDVKIWHTRTNVIADAVVWSRMATRSAVIASTATPCAIPESLLPTFQLGALAFIHRGLFNRDQALMYREQFIQGLAHISGKPPASIELPLQV